MCKYCDRSTNNFQTLNPNTVDYSGIEIAFHHTGILRVRYYDFDDSNANFVSQDMINVKTCPMCGGKIKDDDR